MMFKKIRLFKEKNMELRKKIIKLGEELIESEEKNYKKAKVIADLTQELKQAKSDCTRIQDKVNALEEELSILRRERKEIEDKTKDGIDKDTVITQLVLEKDRLAIENLKYHERMIENDRIMAENYKVSLLSASASISQIPYYPMTGYFNSFRY